MMENNGGREWDQKVFWVLLARIAHYLDRTIDCSNHLITEIIPFLVQNNFLLQEFITIHSTIYFSGTNVYSNTAPSIIFFYIIGIAYGSPSKYVITHSMILWFSWFMASDGKYIKQSRKK